MSVNGRRTWESFVYMLLCFCSSLLSFFLFWGGGGVRGAFTSDPKFNFEWFNWKLPRNPKNLNKLRGWLGATKSSKTHNVSDAEQLNHVRLH